MTRHHCVVCICLGGLVLLAGCMGAEPAPRELPPQTAGPSHATTSEQLAADPEPVKPDDIDVHGELMDGERSRTPEPVESDDDIESDDLAGSPDAAVESQGSQPQVPPEPNAPVQDGKSETAVAATEPDEPAVERSTAAAMPAFLEGYTHLLNDYVHEGGVDYNTLHRRRLDVRQLLMRLDELDPNTYAAWPDGEKLAFWINAYNLKMLDIILRNYPIESSWWLRLTWPPSDIRHIQGIWTDYKFVLMEEEFTLSEVERRFFHRTFNDPRAYLAITYACRSGPALHRRPYHGEDLDRQLDEQVKAFLAGGRGLRIDRGQMVVCLSAIFKPTWRGREFVARYGTDKKFKDRDPETRAVLSFLTRYVSRDDAYFLETENYRIEYANFDWRLNDTSRSH